MLRNFLKRKDDRKRLGTSEKKNVEKSKEIFKKLNFTHVSNSSPLKGHSHFNLNIGKDIRETSIKETPKKLSDDNDYEEMTKRSVSVPSIFTVPFSHSKIRDFLMNDINEERKQLKNDMAISKSKNKFAQIMKLEKILSKNASSLKKINTNTDELMIQNDGTIKYEKESDTNKVNNNNEMNRNSIRINELMYLPLKYQSSFWRLNK